MRAISGSTSRTASPLTASTGCCAMRSPGSCPVTLSRRPARNHRKAGTAGLLLELESRAVHFQRCSGGRATRAVAGVSSPILGEPFAAVAVGVSELAAAHELPMETCSLMPDNSRRRRAPARHHHGHAAERARPDPGTTPALRGRRGRPARPATRRPQAAATDGPHGELDRALAAAADAPAPAPEMTVRELGLPARLVSSLAARGIDAPVAIQARVIPDALAAGAVLGRAQTGSGKTLAFGLPILARLAAAPARRREKAPRALILVPTRELARQVADVLAPLGQPLGVSVTTVYGGVRIGRQIDRMRRGVDVVVATPGRLIDLLDRHAATLDGVEITVVDEADHMADLGFLPDVTRILDATPATGQRMLFSATLDRGVGRLVTAYLSDPALHAVAPESINGGTTEHSVLVLSAKDKVPVAVEIASRPARPPSGLRPDQARRGPPGQAVQPGGRRGRGDPRQPEPDPAAAGASRLRRRATAGACRHKRGCPRYPRGRRRACRSLRPPERPQGLSAPFRAHCQGRSLRQGHRAGGARAGSGHRAAARGGRRHPGHPSRAGRARRGQAACDVGHARFPARGRARRGCPVRRRTARATAPAFAAAQPGTLRNAHDKGLAAAAAPPALAPEPDRVRRSAQARQARIRSCPPSRPPLHLKYEIPLGIWTGRMGRGG